MKQAGIGRDFQLLGGLSLILGAVDLVRRCAVFINESTSKNRPKPVSQEFL